MPQPSQSTRIAHNLMLELATVRKRLEAAEAVVEAARNYGLGTKPTTAFDPHDEATFKAIEAYDKLKGGDAQ